MSKRIHIPHDWYCSPRPDDLNSFITYYGDIFSGTIHEDMNWPDRFWIVQNDFLRSINDLTPENRNFENYNKYGREISNIDIIKTVIKAKEIGQTEQRSVGYKYFELKKMFVFGAAASTFCVFGDRASALKNSLLSSPRGPEIFDEKYDVFCKQHPGVRLTIPYFEEKGKDIEACLEEEWREYRNIYNSQLTARHINIQFYLQKLFSAISQNIVENHSRNNLYSLFANKLQKYTAKKPDERIAMVSFNYDTILDHFIENHFGITYDSLTDYVDWNKNKIVLFKPHGSCNWGWPFRNDRINGNTQETIANALYESKIEPWRIYYHFLGDVKDMVARNTWGYETLFNNKRKGRLTINKNLIEKVNSGTDNVYFPALLIPYRDKDEFVMPFDHYESMEHSFSQIEELYLIGWKGNEDLFNRMLSLRKSDNLKKIIIVNPDSQTVVDNLSRYDLIKTEPIVIKNFEDFILNHFDKMMTEE
jgi:hypothetical protein